MISTMPIILLARQLQRPNCIPSEARQTTWVYKASVSRGADKGTRARLIRYVHVDQIIPDKTFTHYNFCPLQFLAYIYCQSFPSRSKAKLILIECNLNFSPVAAQIQ